MMLYNFLNSMTAIQNVLQKYFGYSTFHPLQEEIINDVLARTDVFILRPTGFVENKLKNYGEIFIKEIKN